MLVYIAFLRSKKLISTSLASPSVTIVTYINDQQITVDRDGKVFYVENE